MRGLFVQDKMRERVQLVLCCDALLFRLVLNHVLSNVNLWGQLLELV